MRRASAIVVAGLIFGLLPAAAAQATDRYVDAVAGANDMGTCTAPPPADGCGFKHAVEDAQTVANDHVIVAPGTYTLATGGNALTTNDSGLKILGPGVTQATLNISTNFGLVVNSANVTVSGLRINHTGLLGDALVFSGSSAGSVAENMSATTAANGFSACRFSSNGQVTLQNSVCQTTVAGAFGAVGVFDGSQTVNLLNVTAHSSQAVSPGIHAFTDSGEAINVAVGNSIISGGGGVGGADVVAQDFGGGGTVIAGLDYSDYDTTSEDDSSANTTVTAPGTLHNVLGAPAFTDTGPTFHQAANSPTIDKGLSAFASGTDIDGGARLIGSAPDIGADEFVSTVVPPTPTPTPTPPAAAAATGPTGARAAALKKCKKKRGPARKRCKKKAQKLPV